MHYKDDTAKNINASKERLIGYIMLPIYLQCKSAWTRNC